LGRHGRAGGRAENGGKAWGRTVDELDAALAQDDVVGRAQPELIGRDVFAELVAMGIAHVA